MIETKALRRSNVVKTAVLRSVSHDLRSPLTAITTAAGGLASRRSSPRRARELTSVIELESARLSRLVDNLLDLSRLQAGAVETRADWCSVEELVRAAIDVRARAAGRLRRPDRRRPAAGPGRRRAARAGDRERARQLRPLRRRRAGQRAGAAPPSSVLLRVGDRGPGIAREELERIFEPFHSPGEGIGHRARARDRARLPRGQRRAHPGRVAARPGDDDRAQLPVPAEQPAGAQAAVE